MSIIEAIWPLLFIGFLLIHFMIFKPIRGRKIERNLFLSLWSKGAYRAPEKEYGKRLGNWKNIKSNLFK